MTFRRPLPCPRALIPLLALLAPLPSGCLKRSYNAAPKASASDAGAAAPAASAYESDGDRLVFEQGWTPADRAWFHTTSQGSRMIPYDWFRALETAEGTRLFSSDEVQAALGYLPSAASPSNPDALPVGFAKDVADPRGTGAAGDDRAWLGFTCAACHTSEITAGGKTVRVDGASGHGDVMAFVSGYTRALRATLSDEAKWGRFAARVAASKAPRPATRAEVEAFTARMEAYVKRNTPFSPAGKARVPHFGLLVNESNGTALGLPENATFTTRSFTTIPYLWGFTELDWVGANASVNNPIARMSLEAMGVQAVFRVTSDAPPAFESSIRMEELHGMEEVLAKLKPPRWPEDLLGAIDRDRAARGAALYAANCEQCHTTEGNHRYTDVNSFGRKSIKVTVVPLAEIGTDPVLVEEMLSRKSKTGRFAAALGGKDEVLALELSRFAIASHLRNEFVRRKFDPAKIAAYTGFRENTVPGDLRSYKARPIAGIWAKGHYLHNGAVPTLAALLAPAAERPAKFWVGSTAYDAAAVGFAHARETPDATLFDTSLPGNSNRGHEDAPGSGDTRYGTNLKPEEKRDLLEYLKTL